ncbi:hypothetical protein G6F59_017997 [Rhizopus arrhizus]|nr:hypothetical protein G6F59_017997 [Rhizopus arrhizus]
MQRLAGQHQRIERIVVTGQGTRHRTVVGRIGDRHRLEAVHVHQAVFLDLVLGEAAGRNLHCQVHFVRRLLRLGHKERVQHGIGGGHRTGQQQQGSADGSKGKDTIGSGHRCALIPSNGRRDPWRSANGGSRAA